MTLALKRLICRVLVGVLVSAQFAIAAYACPGLSGAMGGETAVVAGVSSTAVDARLEGMDPHVSMAGAEMDSHHGHAAIDPASPHLCMGHCQFGKQSADHASAPVVSPALLTALYTLPATREAAVSGTLRASSATASPPAAGDPPHAILHCCFRD